MADEMVDGRTDGQEEYRLTSEERKLVSKIEERLSLTGGPSVRWEIERKIYENLAMFCGEQWLQIDDASRRVMPWKAPSWFPKPVTNLIAPRVAMMVANIVRSRPQGRVRPVSNDPADREAARVAEQILQHLYQVTREETLRTRAALIAALTGTVIAEDTFNPRAGQRLLVPRVRMVEKPVMVELENGEKVPRTWPDGQPMVDVEEEQEVDEEGRPIVDLFMEGEIESRVRPLINFYWDPKADSLENAQWCGEVMLVDKEWIYRNFPSMARHVKPVENLQSAYTFTNDLLNLVGDFGAPPPSSLGRDHIVVRKYQEKPSGEHPNGLMMIIASGVILYRGPLMIKDARGQVTGDFTYTEFCYDEVPGRLHGRTPVEDMCALQRRINAIDAHIIINRKTLLNPWILAPKGSGFEPGQVAMRPGATVEYVYTGVVPQVIPGTPLPAQIIQERELAEKAMDQLLSDASMHMSGQLPSGIKSGIALNFLRELQQEQLIPRLNRWGQWIAARDRKRLLLAQEYYREPRAVKLLGLGSEWQVRQWRGSDLRGNTDVTVDIGTLVPKAQSLKTQMVFDGLEAGIIDIRDPVQRQRIIERLELGDFETEIGPDQRRARKENAQMDSGIPVSLTEFEDKRVHLQEHIARVKDPSFDSLSEESQQLFLRHIAETEAALQQETEQQKQRMEEELSRRLVLAERAQAAGIKVQDLENPQNFPPILGQAGGVQ